jgi:hypothetical protein
VSTDVSIPLSNWIGLTVVIADTVWPDQHQSVTDLGQAIPRVPRCIMGTAWHLGWTVLAERSGRRAMNRNPEFGNVTGTRDKDYVLGVLVYLIVRGGGNVGARHGAAAGDAATAG